MDTSVSRNDRDKVTDDGQTREFPQVMADVIDLLPDRYLRVFPNPRNAVSFVSGVSRHVFTLGKELHS